MNVWEKLFVGAWVAFVVFAGADLVVDIVQH